MLVSQQKLRQNRPALFFSSLDLGDPHVSVVVLGCCHFFRVPLKRLLHERLDLGASEQPNALKGVLDDRDRLWVVTALPSNLFLVLRLRGQEEAERRRQSLRQRCYSPQILHASLGDSFRHRLRLNTGNSRTCLNQMPFSLSTSTQRSSGGAILISKAFSCSTVPPNALSCGQHRVETREKGSRNIGQVVAQTVNPTGLLFVASDSRSSLTGVSE